MAIFDVMDNGRLLTSLTIQGDYYVACEDIQTGKIRLVNLDTGKICRDEFNDIVEVLKVMDLNDHVIRRRRFNFNL